MRDRRKYCVNVHCSSTPKCTEVDHENRGVTIPEGLTGKHYSLKCKVCGYESLEPLPRHSIKRHGWPYYNASVGVTFESESHEKKFTKANNLTKRE